LGATYVALKQPEQGAAILQRYLATNPSDAWAHLQLGKAFADQGKGDQAVAEFQRAARLDGNLDEAHRLLGMSLGRQGDQGQGFYQLAVAAKLRGDLEQAYSLFDRAKPLLAEGSPQRAEVDAALEELQPLVRERERERAQPRRRGLAPGPCRRGEQGPRLPAARGRRVRRPRRQGRRRERSAHVRRGRSPGLVAARRRALRQPRDRPQPGGAGVAAAAGPPAGRGARGLALEGPRRQGGGARLSRGRRPQAARLRPRQGAAQAMDQPARLPAPPLGAAGG